MKNRDRLLAERIAHERELRIAEKAAFDHERELRAIYDAHERELRLQQEFAVEKARQYQIDTLEIRLEGMNALRAQLDAQAKTFLPADRFEREHSNLRERYEREHNNLIERHVRDIEELNDRVDQQEKVTVRQDTTTAVLEGVASTRRWLIGLAIATVFSLFGLVATLITLITHLNSS